MEIFPLVPLRDSVVFPKSAIPVLIRRKRTIAAVDAALMRGRHAFFVAQRHEDVDVPGIDDLYAVGTIAEIREVERDKQGGMRILVEGMIRGSLNNLQDAEGYTVAGVEPVAELVGEENDKVQALQYTVVNQFKACVQLGLTVPLDALLLIVNMNDARQLCDLVALNGDFRVEEMQAVLEAKTIEQKLQATLQGLSRASGLLKMAKKLESETGKELDKMQREMYLREQMRAIEKELGVLGGTNEVEELREKIKSSQMPKDVGAHAMKELGRLEKMPPYAPESSYVRTYLEWLIDVPWTPAQLPAIDLAKSQKILDADHFGLPKVKERILEYLAVQKLVGHLKGPILCFVGPPGVGKTSIGRSIAKSLGRPFVRMSLGGVRDEAEIRGHRRTYVGAMPGRIIQSMKQAKNAAPVIMLDEIDKMGFDSVHGDPGSALLEALDPEQNKAFVDHYLEVPYDVSQVLFVATANSIDNLPAALRDRMEIIGFSGYTEAEKKAIAKKYLIPKQRKDHGLTEKQCRIPDETLEAVIRSYTLESGVRELERVIGAICRKLARAVAQGRAIRGDVKISQLKAYLGNPKYSATIKEHTNIPGVVTGLAWTPFGGDILYIEAAKMPGKGKLTLTGQLGKVMQESAQAAFSVARGLGRVYDIEDAWNTSYDIHVHVPDGATPKDGPSAGIALVCALISVLSGKPIPSTIGMTGEVTLRGRVGKIGGLKEKVLAAHRAGLTTIIAPWENKRDLDDIPQVVRDALTIYFVKTVDEVLKIVFGKPTKPSAASPKK